jgi:hypothetical protein
MKCPICGKIDNPFCQMRRNEPYDPDAGGVNLENGRRLNLEAERGSYKIWADSCDRRAQTRVARAGFRKAARARAKEQR